MFRHRKKPPIAYIPKTMKPVLHCSICNGEQVFGFKNLENGEFIEVSLIRTEAELAEYMKMYGLESVEKEY